MDVTEWRDRYIKELTTCGLSEFLAIETYDAGCPHDQGSEPEDAACDELSYWGDG